MYRSKTSAVIFPPLAIVPALLAAMLSVPAISSARSANTLRPFATINSASVRSVILAQDESPPDEDAVPTDQVDKYIAVYTAMQKNHSLSVEQAAAKQGLTVDQFRSLEDKIERNPVVHERVLDALKASSSGGKAANRAEAGKTP